MAPSPSPIPQSVEIQKHLSQIHIDEWLKGDVFHPRWWILLGLIILSVTVWYLLLDKARLKEIVLYTLLSAILMLGVYEYGEELILWEYPTDVIPIFPPLSSINLFLLPLTYSLLYQYFRSKKSFMIAAILASVVLCLIVEPILAWGKLYQLINWHYLYSIPVYFIIATSVKLTADWVIQINERSKQKM